jgi:hypothetical protein
MLKNFLEGRAEFPALDGFDATVERPNTQFPRVVLAKGGVKVSLDIEEIEQYASVVVEFRTGEDAEYFHALTSGDWLYAKGLKARDAFDALADRELEAQINDWLRKKRARRDVKEFVRLVYRLVTALIERGGGNKA